MDMDIVLNGLSAPIQRVVRMLWSIVSFLTIFCLLSIFFPVWPLPDAFYIAIGVAWFLFLAITFTLLGVEGLQVARSEGWPAHWYRNLDLYVGASMWLLVLLCVFLIVFQVLQPASDFFNNLPWQLDLLVVGVPISLMIIDMIIKYQPIMKEQQRIAKEKIEQQKQQPPVPATPAEKNRAIGYLVGMAVVAILSIATFINAFWRFTSIPLFLGIWIVLGVFGVFRSGDHPHRRLWMTLKMLALFFLVAYVCIPFLPHAAFESAPFFRIGINILASIAFIVCLLDVQNNKKEQTAKPSLQG